MGMLGNLKQEQRTVEEENFIKGTALTGFAGKNSFCYLSFGDSALTFASMLAGTDTVTNILAHLLNECAILIFLFSRGFFRPSLLFNTSSSQ